MPPGPYDVRFCNTDCNDDPNNGGFFVHPDVFPTVVCDGISNDCSEVDVASSVLQDLDHDGVFNYTGTDAFEKIQCAKHFPIGDCDDHNNHTHPGLSELSFPGDDGHGHFGDGLDNDCNGLIDDIIKFFVQFKFHVRLLPLGEAANSEDSARKHSCEPNYALLITLDNTAALSTATNVIIKGKLALPHDARLPVTVLGDLSNYGVKLDAKTGAVTWVQFSLPALSSQLVAIPLCLDVRHGTGVRLSLNVASADQTIYDVFFHLGGDHIEFP